MTKNDVFSPKLKQEAQLIVIARGFLKGRGFNLKGAENWKAGVCCKPLEMEKVF